MSDELRFHGWQRSGVYDLVTGGLEEGRLKAALPVTLQDREDASDSVTRDIPFLIIGPRDVLALQAGAITGMMPPPGTVAAEATRYAHVELSDVDLPWRYTPQVVDPAVAGGRKLCPWLVLVVGTPETLILAPRNLVTLTSTVTTAHDLNHSARWAHVQEDGHKPVARLLSPWVLQPETAYVAAVVPAFKADGTSAWTPGATVTLPCFHTWRFKTGEAGDFRTLASKLKPGEASPELGRAPLTYNRVSPSEELSVRGALAPIGGTDAPLSQAVIDDVAVLTAPLTDPRGRPLVSLPTYGAPWVADPSTTSWGSEANGDPRHRGTGGLGLWAGIRLQEQLMDAATQQAGALGIAAQRIRNLTLGLGASRSLWKRRLPTDPMQRLWLYGPSLRRMVTGQGSVLGQVAGGDRPLPPRLFSSAARRVLRRGPARTDLAQPEAALPSRVLPFANTCALPPVRGPEGLPHSDRVSKMLNTDNLDERLREGLERGALPREAWVRRIKEAIARSSYGSQLEAVLVVVESSRNYSRTLLLALLDAVDRKDDREVKRLREEFLRTEIGDGGDLLDLGKDLVTEAPERPCRPVDLDRLEEVLTAAIDPTVPEPLVVRRVLDGITGLSEPKLAPVEVCLGLDMPVWRFLRDHAPDWLLPGVGSLKEDDVVAVQSNPAFVDAFLLGLNAQILSELRWRNIPIAAGCTPLRMFWGQVDSATDSRKPDIVGVANWPAASSLGSDAHQPPPPVGTDLVVVFRSDLFRRYPRTLVYVTQAALVNGEPDWHAEPDLASGRLLPTFQGSIGEDITFFRFDLDPQAARKWWVVLEEPPSGYTFRNDVGLGGAQDGADFADHTFNDPLRVLIRGEALIPGGA
ncbi:hypothetical protein MFUL124B02_30905 [Myxococcus fulvus 124B02]|nr:hypothetical protein MFUL124B02_30905 [Myxococcus fulvus 124B02]